MNTDLHTSCPREVKITESWGKGGPHLSSQLICVLSCRSKCWHVVPVPFQISVLKNNNLTYPPPVVVQDYQLFTSVSFIMQFKPFTIHSAIQGLSLWMCFFFFNLLMETWLFLNSSVPSAFPQLLVFVSCNPFTCLYCHVCSVPKTQFFWNVHY